MTLFITLQHMFCQTNMIIKFTSLFLNSFQVNFAFLYPFETSENLWLQQGLSQICTLSTKWQCVNYGATRLGYKLSTHFRVTFTFFNPFSTHCLYHMFIFSTQGTTFFTLIFLMFSGL